MSKRKRDEEKKLTGGDREEITAVIHGFLHALDGNDPKGFSSLFDEQGVCEIVKFGKTCKGPAELEQLCSSLAEKFAGVMHWEGNVLITGSGENASNLSYRERPFSVLGAQKIPTSRPVLCGQHAQFWQRIPISRPDPGIRRF